MADTIDVTAPKRSGHYQLTGSPAAGLTMGTWGFFVGFAAVALYGPAAKYFQDQMHLGGLALGLLVAAPQLTGSLLRIPFGAWVDRVGGRLPMLTLFGLSLVGMWGLVFILITVKTLTISRLSDRHLVRVLERMRCCLVFSRHSAGVLLVPAITSGHSARRLWRNRQSCAGPFHTATAFCHRQLGIGRVLLRLVHVPSGRGLRSMPGLPGTLISSNCANKASIRRTAEGSPARKVRSSFRTNASGRRSFPPLKSRAPGVSSLFTSCPSAASSH